MMLSADDETRPDAPSQGTDPGKPGSTGEPRGATTRRRGAPVPATREPLPPTISADGVHFTAGHALLIGVGAYTDPRLRIPDGTTATDVRTLAALLRNPRLAAYPAAQVQVLTDAKATRANILDALGDLAQRLAGTPNATALLYFAGHGVPVATGYGLLPYDTDLHRLEASVIAAPAFHRLVTKIGAHARQLVVLLNCCDTGGAADELLQAAGVQSGTAPPPAFYRPLAAEDGQVVISSARPGQRAGARSQSAHAHTPFGAQLLDALQGKAPGAGPTVNVAELFAYLRVTVPADASHIWYGGEPIVQEPLIYTRRLGEEVAVGLRPGGVQGADQAALVRRLVELELQLEDAGAEAPGATIAERDRLLDTLRRR